MTNRLEPFNGRALPVACGGPARTRQSSAAVPGGGLIQQTPSGEICFGCEATILGEELPPGSVRGSADVETATYILSYYL